MLSLSHLRWSLRWHRERGYAAERVVSLDQLAQRQTRLFWCFVSWIWLVCTCLHISVQKQYCQRLSRYLSIWALVSSVELDLFFSMVQFLKVFTVSILFSLWRARKAWHPSARPWQGLVPRLRRGHFLDAVRRGDADGLLAWKSGVLAVLPRRSHDTKEKKTIERQRQIEQIDSRHEINKKNPQNRKSQVSAGVFVSAVFQKPLTNLLSLHRPQR